MKKLIAQSETTEPVLAKHKTCAKKTPPPRHQSQITCRFGTVVTYRYQREHKESDKVRIDILTATTNSRTINTWLTQNIPQTLTITLPLNETPENINQSVLARLRNITTDSLRASQNRCEESHNQLRIRWEHTKNPIMEKPILQEVANQISMLEESIQDIEYAMEDGLFE